MRSSAKRKLVQSERTRAPEQDYQSPKGTANGSQPARKIQLGEVHGSFQHARDKYQQKEKEIRSIGRSLAAVQTPHTTQPWH